jgi:Baseplate J-like protein
MSQKIIYLSPKEELTNVRERLENTDAVSIILVVPPQTQLRSHVGWRLLRSFTRERGQDVQIITSDRQIRAVVKAAGFRVAETLESYPSDRSRPINRPVRRRSGGKSSQGTSQQASSGKKITRSLPSNQQQMPPLEPLPSISTHHGAGDQEDGEIDSLEEDYYIARSIREAERNSNRGEVSPAIENTETSRGNVERSSKIPQPGEIEDDPFGYMEDIQPVALPEQRGSTFIHDADQDIPGISDVPTDAGVEDLGDVGEEVLRDDWPFYAPDKQTPEESDKQDIQDIWGVPPRSSRMRNPMRPSLDDLKDEDDLLPQSIPLPDQQGRRTQSSTVRSEPQPIIQPPPQPRNVASNPLSKPSKRPVISSRGRVVSPPPPPVRRRVGTRGTTSRRSLITLLMILSTLFVLFLVGGYLVSNNILPGVVFSATATITPVNRDLKNTYVITGVVGIPDASQRQIQARMLSYTTTSQAKTILVSGVGHIPATVARGSLTFFNALPYSQAIVAGTVFTDNNGVQVVNDTSAIIPAARPPTEGSLTIPAHSITIGAKGNIPALAFNDVPCCIAGITVQNQAAFSGGQDQRDFTFVQQSDIDGVVNAEKASLIQHAESALHAEFFQNEQLINPDTCTSDTSSDHVAGDKATSVTVALTVTCTGEVFDGQAAQSMAANLLTSQAVVDPGAGYALVGRIVTTFNQIELKGVRNGTIILHVSAEGIWAYQFSDSSKKMLAELVAGKNSTDAQSLLMHQVGIAKADIKVSGIFPALSMLPGDPGRIIIVIQSVHAL